MSAVLPSDPGRASKARNLLILGLVLLAIMQIARFAFLWSFGSQHLLFAPKVDNSLYIGLKFDLRLAALLLMAPWLLLQPGLDRPRRRWLGGAVLLGCLVLFLGVVLVWMVDDRPARPWLVALLAMLLVRQLFFRDHGLASGREVRWIWAGYALLLANFVLAAYATDFGSYSYNHVRLNGTILGFLQNPLISAQMVWQSYPVLRGALLILALNVALLWGLRRLRGWQPLALGSRARWSANVAITVMMILAMWGKASLYPLRWGEVFDGRDRFVAQVALNPVLFFLETRITPDRGPDLPTVRATHQAMANYFGIPKVYGPRGEPTLLRTIVPRPLVSGTPNVVFIQLESLSLYKTSLLGNALDPTPFLRTLADRSLFFEHFHVVMENTSRSMFATLFGIPDVSGLDMNATRNPLLVDQHCLLNALHGYEKYYFLGGSANWAQIRAAFQNNVPGLRIYEEGSYRAPVVDVWGISDADLLIEGGERLAHGPRPYFAYFQTSGNHPPFTIPPHLTDFRKTEIPQPTLAGAGFVDNAELNAVRLMDYSLKRFFAAQEQSPDYLNTVYVLWADHGILRANLDKRFEAVPLIIQRIPLLVFAPGFIKEGRRVASIGSQMDILPTVMSLLGHETQTQTLGKDLLDPRYARSGGAFTFSTWQRPPVIGFIQGHDYLIRNPDGRTFLYDLDAPTEQDHAAERPERTAELLALTQGFYAWSRYLMEHNRPLARK
jgi:hypothetical protein